jgi:hypothetical protein
MKKVWIFLISVLSVFQTLQAQEEPEMDYIPLGIGINFYQSKDAFTSALRYRGYVLQAHLGYEGFNSQVINRGRAEYAFGELKNGAKYVSKLNMNQVAYRQMYLSHFHTEQNLNLFIGATLKINFSNRSGSRVNQFDAQATLAITGGFTYMNAPSDKWFYEGNMSLPIAGWGMRPRFASSNYILPEKEYKGPSHHFIIFPKYFDVDVNLMAYWDMGTNNYLRMDYRWWFYDMKYGHRVRAMQHGLNVGMLTRVK